MRNSLLILTLACVCLSVTSQDMRVKIPNLTSFNTDKKVVNDLLEKKSSPDAKKHPEYGVLPYNTQCASCMELIDKRAIDSRLYIDVKDPGHTYSQKSFFPIHYQKSENDIWRTIDLRLRPDANNPGIYRADDQPVPTKCDLNKKTTSLTEEGFEFEFNKDLTMYFIDENVASTKPEKGNYSNYTIGEEGMRVTNIWPGMDMLQLFKVGAVESNFVISAPLNLPISKGWMVIEDHFTLPAGYTFVESANGEKKENGGFSGDYILKNAHGDSLVIYDKPIYIDTRAWGQHGIYKLLQTGNDYTLQMLIPVSWLNSEDNLYPIYIDPLVEGYTKIGNFRSTNQVSANLAYTSMALGSCDYQMSVTVPGRSELTNAYVDLEYELTYDNTCGNPHELAPYCTFSQVTMEVVCDSCQSTTGLLSCHPASPPYTGTCTTDSVLVPGAHALLINSFNPTFLSCYPPQCADYNIPFTLKNRDSICLDVCGYLCARGNMWQMTVEAQQIQATMQFDGQLIGGEVQICAGQPATFSATAIDGVPPYHFLWSTDGGTTYDTVYDNNTFTTFPQNGEFVSCVGVDTCGQSAQAGQIQVVIIPTPPAEAGPDQYVCASGGTVTIGGNPTTSPGDTISWTAQDAMSLSWLSNDTIPNPTVTIPPGLVDSFYYIVRSANTSCFRTDTVFVHSLANPVATIDTSGSTVICANQNVTISVTDTFSSYLWNTGATTQSIQANQAGRYTAVVTDDHGCKDTTNTITVTGVSVPTVHVYPDTTILFGDSVMVYSDVNLNAAAIDSYTWYPSANISCLICPNPYASPTNIQQYGLIVYQGGCVISDSVIINVILPNNFFIPNAFTPNGDGNNDYFYIDAQSGVRVVLFEVYDRLGEKVHEGNIPWDGNFKGKPCPAGVYVYIFKLGLFGDNTAIMRKGSVTLMR
jgi:gliding motility-associated-like protein